MAETEQKRGWNLTRAGIKHKFRVFFQKMAAYDFVIIFFGVLLAFFVPVIFYVYFTGLEQTFIKYRWIFVCFLLMPLSVVFEAFLKVRNWLIFKLKSAPLMHDSKVNEIQKQVKEWYAGGRRTLMCTARSGWLTVSLRIGKYA